MQLGYRMVDADHHDYQLDHCSMRHLEPGFADRAVRVMRGRARTRACTSVTSARTSAGGEGPPGSPRDFLAEKAGSQGARIAGP